MTAHHNKYEINKKKVGLTFSSSQITIFYQKMLHPEKYIKFIFIILRVILRSRVRRSDKSS